MTARHKTNKLSLMADRLQVERRLWCVPLQVGIYDSQPKSAPVNLLWKTWTADTAADEMVWRHLKKRQEESTPNTNSQGLLLSTGQLNECENDDFKAENGNRGKK